MGSIQGMTQSMCGVKQLPKELIRINSLRPSDAYTGQ